MSVVQPRWLSAREQRAWQAYRRSKALLDRVLYRDLAAEAGLSESDYDVLSTLTEVPSRRWRATELAERLLWSSSRLSHHIGRMEGRGLVRRKECSDDGRGALISLTPKGAKVIEAAAVGHVASVRRNLIDRLNTDEMIMLEQICSKLVGHLEAEDR